MPYVNIHPKMRQADAADMARRLNMRIEQLGSGRTVMVTPNHDHLQREQHGNQGVVRLPRYRRQLGPDYDPEPPPAAA